VSPDGNYHREFRRLGMFVNNRPNVFNAIGAFPFSKARFPGIRAYCQNLARSAFVSLA
jgi:hypothetical protein